jgi:WD40 repeat protein
VYRLDFSPDGRLLASAGLDRAVRVWDLERGGPPAVCTGHTDGIFDVAFSPDGRRLATGSFDGKVKVWQVAAANRGLVHTEK